MSLNIKKLSDAIQKLSKEGIKLTSKDRHALVLVTNSVNNASKAITSLANQIPLATQLAKDIPEILAESQEPIDKISKSIEAASKGVFNISSIFPEIQVASKKIIKDSLDSIFTEIKVYTVLFFALLLFAILAILYTVYSKVLEPVITKLDEFKNIPAQLKEMTLYMQKTSENLLKLDESKGID